jgi:hypothetical protein
MLEVRELRISYFWEMREHDSHQVRSGEFGVTDNWKSVSCAAWHLRSQCSRSRFECFLGYFSPVISHGTVHVYSSWNRALLDWLSQGAMSDWESTLKRSLIVFYTESESQ